MILKLTTPWCDPLSGIYLNVHPAPEHWTSELVVAVNPHIDFVVIVADIFSVGFQVRIYRQGFPASEGAKDRVRLRVLGGHLWKRGRYGAGFGGIHGRGAHGKTGCRFTDC